MAAKRIRLSARKPRHQFGFEMLETRLAMAWAGGGWPLEFASPDAQVQLSAALNEFVSSLRARIEQSTIAKPSISPLDATIDAAFAQNYVVQPAPTGGVPLARSDSQSAASTVGAMSATNELLTADLATAAKPPIGGARVESHSLGEGRWNARTSLRGVMIAPDSLRDPEARAKLIDELRMMDINIVRYQMNHGKNDTYETNYVDYRAWVTEQLDSIEQALPELERAGIQIILDLHSPPGQFGAGEYYEGEGRQILRQVWREIATRFKDSPAIAGYDLINEPDKVPGAVKKLNNLFTQLINDVRAIDPDTPIIIEPVAGLPEYLTQLKVFPKNLNVVYSPHFYKPGGYTHQGIENKKDEIRPSKSLPNDMDRVLDKWLVPIRKWQREHGLHVLIGEFSVTFEAEGALTWLQKVTARFEEYGWDHIYHAWREDFHWDLLNGVNGETDRLRYMVDVVWDRNRATASQPVVSDPSIDRAFEEFNPTEAYSEPLQPSVPLPALPQPNAALIQAIEARDAAEAEAQAAAANLAANKAVLVQLRSELHAAEAALEAAKLDLQKLEQRHDELAVKLRAAREALREAPKTQRAEREAKVERLEKERASVGGQIDAAQEFRRLKHYSLDAASARFQSGQDARDRGEEADKMASERVKEAKKKVASLSK